MVTITGTTYATAAIVRSTNPDTMATRSRRSLHQARRYGPADFGSFGRRGRSASTAATIGARAMSGGPDLGVDEAIRDVHEQIGRDIRARGEQDDRLDERVILRQDRVDRELPDALPREYRLDDDAAGEHPADLKADDRHDGNERVAEGVP